MLPHAVLLSVVAETVAVGPSPPFVEASIVHVYEVDGRNSSTVIFSITFKSISLSPSSPSSLVQVSVYETSVPPISSSDGGSHSNVSVVFSTLTTKLRGGPIGAVHTILMRQHIP